MHIDLVEKDSAPDLVRRLYDGLEHAGRPVGNFHKALAHKPDVLRAFLQLSGAIMVDGSLSLKLKELAYLRTSIVNGCAYCTRSHAASGKRQGITDEQIAALKEPGGRRRADLFSPEEQAILRYTDLLCSYPGNIEQADLDALGQYFSQEQVIELALAIATANWTNRVNDGLQVPLR